MAVKTKAQRKQRKGPINLLKKLAVISFMCYAVVTLVAQQVTIAEKKEQLATLKEKRSTYEAENAEYERLLNYTDEKKYMEAIAISKYGYAYPNERRFYDTSRN